MGFAAETDDLTLEFTILDPKPYNITLNLSTQSEKALMVYEILENSQNKVGELKTVAISKFIELSIPFSLLNLKANDEVSMIMLVKRNNFEIERWPNHGLISFKVPGEDFILDYWEV